jgi:hypothetical protein
MMRSGRPGANLVLEGVVRVHDMLGDPREDWRCARDAAMLGLWRKQMHGTSPPATTNASASTKAPSTSHRSESGYVTRHMIYKTLPSHTPIRAESVGSSAGL